MSRGALLQVVRWLAGKVRDYPWTDFYCVLVLIAVILL